MAPRQIYCVNCACDKMTYRGSVMHRTLTLHSKKLAGGRKYVVLSEPHICVIFFRQYIKIDSHVSDFDVAPPRKTKQVAQRNSLRP